jgi:hypothetical protein
MNNIFKILSLALVVTLATSCERDQGEYPYLENREVLLSFSSSSGQLLVEQGAENAYPVLVGASTSIESGTYSVSLDDSSTAVEGVDFVFESTLEDGSLSVSFENGTIVSSFNIIADFDNSIEEGKTVVLNLSSSDSSLRVTPSGSQFELTLIKFCPIAAPFTGDFTLTTVATGIFDSVVLVNGTVTITEGETPTDRVISVATYPEFGAFPAIDFQFSLVCGNVVVPSGQATGVGCGSSTTLGPAAELGTYDPSDDSSFNIIFADDEGGASCGAEYAAEITLTKI